MHTCEIDAPDDLKPKKPKLMETFNLNDDDELLQFLHEVDENDKKDDTLEDTHTSVTEPKGDGQDISTSTANNEAATTMSTATLAPIPGKAVAHKIGMYCKPPTHAMRTDSGVISKNRVVNLYTEVVLLRKKLAAAELSLESAIGFLPK
jgi:hypothetical protein